MDEGWAPGSEPSDDWVCSNCGDSLRCSSCTVRRPALSPEDRAGVALALAKQAARRKAEKGRTPRPPAMLGDAIHIAVTGAILLAHVALIGLSVYAVWYEVTIWGGDVAFVFVVAGVLGVYGTWRSAEGLVNRTWQAARALIVTVPAIGLLIAVLPFLTWSRSGP